MTISNHRHILILARIRRYSIDQLLRLSDLAWHEESGLNDEWARLRMTDAQHARWCYVNAFGHLIGVEIDRRLAAPIERIVA